MSKQNINVLVLVLAVVTMLTACSVRDLSAETTTGSITTTPIHNTTSNGELQSRPPVVFSIREQETLTLMRKAVTDDEALQKFLKEDSSPLMKDREDVVAFLELLDSMPNLMVKDAVSFVMEYFPTKNYMDVWFYMGDNPASDRYLITYVTDEDKALKRRQSILQEYQNCPERGRTINNISTMSVLAKVRIEPVKMDVFKTDEYWIDVDGWVVKVLYMHNKSFPDSSALEKVFAPIRVEETFQWS